jgi:hypothetical protein
MATKARAAALGRWLQVRDPAVWIRACLCPECEGGTQLRGLT